jgi:hypothetical protein
MKLYLTRDSVAAGDDVGAPHLVEIEGPTTEDIGAAIANVLGIGYLPRVSGGRATWSVASNRIIAVLAQQWSEAKLLRSYDTSYKGLDIVEDRLRLHFNYHGQQEPETVLEILRRVRLTAI